MFASTGVLRYSDNPYRLVADIDPELAEYYRTLIPRWIRVNRPKYPPHISVVRHEVPELRHWGRYEGCEVEFNYTNIVHFGTVYVWLNVFSVRLEEIRAELGLPVSSLYTRPPDGFVKCFHTTLANFKGGR